MSTNDYILAVQRLAEFVEVDCVGLEGVWLDGAGRSVLIKVQFSELPVVCQEKRHGTHRTAISNAIRANHAEAQLEELWDLVSPGHRQVREAMDLQSY
jgi:hypothetical protein